MDEFFNEVVDDVLNFFEVDEYRFDFVEFVFDRQEVFLYLYYVFYVFGFVMVVIICWDVYFRDSEGGFILGDIEIVLVVEGLLFLEVLEGGNFDDENQYEFFID